MEVLGLELNLFDSFPEPVLYLSGGQIQYSNAALLALEPTWGAGVPIPSALHMEPEADGLLLCRAGRRQFQGTLTPTDGGALMVLRPLATPPEVQQSALPGLLREQAQMIFTALHLLEKSGTQTPADAMNTAAVRKGAFCVLRLARRLELAGDMARQAPLAEQTVDLSGLCRQVAQSVQDLICLMELSLELDLPDGMVFCAGDPALLETMLLELLSNAAKATPRGEALGLRLRTEGGRVLLTVWDSGPGLSQQELAELGRPLRPDALPKAGVGLRLGLSIAAQAAQAHGGTLLLECQEGHGLTVTVSFPKRRTGAALLHSPRGDERAEEVPHILTMLSDILPAQAFVL
ncbi:MAG: hypothetical protein LIO42_06585 [Oscillospiraceae bacterium]|nr:hypothetical protein [Oscillospiraceae bacterium]